MPTSSEVTNISFSDQSDFTYDSAVVEFSRRVALKNQHASDVLVAARFYSGKTLDYSRDGGPLSVEEESGTVNNTNNVLNLTDASFKKIIWDGHKNTLGTVGCVEFDYIPNYNGSPGVIQNIILLMDGPGSSRNMIVIQHLTDGNLSYQVCRWGTNTTGQGQGAYVAVSGTPAKIQLNFDMANNTYALYLNTNRLAQGGTGAYTPKGYDKSHGQIRVGNDLNDNTGSSYNANYSLANLRIYDAIQNSGATRSLPTALPTSKYAMTDEIVKLTTPMAIDGNLQSFSADYYAAGSDSVKFIIYIDTVAYYYNGSAWVTSDETLAQSSTADQIHAGRATLPAGTNYQPAAILHSNDGSTTPELYSMTLLIESETAIAIDAPTSCLVYGYYTDPTGEPIEGATVTFSPDRKTNKIYVEAADRIIGTSVSVTTDEDGYFEADLISSSEFENGGKYKVTFEKASAGIKTQFMSRTKNDIEIEVPDDAEANITDLIVQEEDGED